MRSQGESRYGDSGNPENRPDEAQLPTTLPRILPWRRPLRCCPFMLRAASNPTCVPPQKKRPQRGTVAFVYDLLILVHTARPETEANYNGLFACVRRHALAAAVDEAGKSRIHAFDSPSFCVGRPGLPVLASTATCQPHIYQADARKHWIKGISAKQEVPGVDQVTTHPGFQTPKWWPRKVKLFARHSRLASIP